MRILLLGPVHREKDYLEQKGKYPFFKHQGQQAWFDSLTSLGHEVSVFRYTDSYFFPQRMRVNLSEFSIKYFPIWYERWRRYKDIFSYISLDNIFKNKRLLRIADQVQPEVVFISGGIFSVFPETINEIKKRYSCPVLLFSGINPETGASLDEKKMVKDRIIDFVIENDEGYAKLWKKMGAKKTIVLPISSVDRNIHKKMTLTKKEKKEYSCDVCFVGTLSTVRQTMLSNLKKYDLKIWGDLPSGVDLLPELSSCYQGNAYGEKMVKIFNAAKIVLNFQPASMTKGGNMRLFEISGSGAFQLVDKMDRRWFTDGKEVVLFKDVKDLKKKIEYYLGNEIERKKIAHQGYIRAHKEHTYEKHFQLLLSLYER